MLASAGEAQAAVEVAASSLEELAIHKVAIAHKLGEINATGPSDVAWQELRRLVGDARQQNSSLPFGLRGRLMGSPLSHGVSRDRAPS